MASPAGFEPTTSGLGILRSILLSYGDAWLFVSGKNSQKIGVCLFFLEKTG